MKSIAWAILLAGMFITMGLEKIAVPTRKATDAENKFTFVVFVCFIVSVLI